MSTLDLSAGKDAIAKLMQFPHQISDVSASISSTPLGPWQLNVKCDYDKVLFFNVKTKHYWWNVDFSGPRASLQDTLQAAQMHGSAFLQGFQPVHDWLAVTLPGVSAQFDTATENIQQVYRQIQGGAPATDAEKAQVASELDQILAGLQQSSEQLKSGMAALAQYMQDQEACQRAVDQSKDALVSDANGVLSNMREFIDQQPCGHSDAYNQFNSFKAQFDLSASALGSAFDQLHQHSKEADDALAVLLGTLMNCVNEYQEIAGEVRSVEAARLGSVIQEFRIDVARDEWSDLANYATEQLQVAA